MNATEKFLQKQAGLFNWSNKYTPKPGDHERLNAILDQHGIPRHAAHEMLGEGVRAEGMHAKIPDPPRKLEGFFRRNRGKIGLGAAGLLGVYGVAKMMQPAQPSEEEMMAQQQAQQGGF